MKTMPAALLCSVVLLAACGSDDSGSAAADDARSTEAPAEAEPADTEPAETEAPVETEPPATDAPAETAVPVETEVPADTAAPADTEPAAPPAGGFSINGLRYCEILMTVVGDDGAEVTEVWGTPGLDPCDDDAWDALDPDAIRSEYEASWIDMNGPRYFVVDGTADTGEPGSGGTGVAAGGESEVRQYGDVSMALLATVDGASVDDVPYVPELVVRTTTWTFEAGAEVYELTDPEGNTYVMQSYALIEDPSLTAADLPALGDRLDLPEGWSYGARVLDAPLKVALADGGAMVMVDEFRNSYQRNG